MDVFDHPIELPFPEANLTARGSSSVAAENDAERMYRACFFFSIQNFSLSDPTIDWSEPRKLLQGCGISPISQFFPNIDDGDRPSRHVTPVVPVNYFMYAARCVCIWMVRDPEPKRSFFGGSTTNQGCNDALVL
ncbi:unnamed protein product [Cladocopium goreaui]|uniref:Uncharacterized protein n=1 Tax=Cladocopium goreaui TaxID=2562237 RepID=A0A9P1DNF7_9DINO|nr:unnamed protein product [Cladocopium goreaui]